jgi:hypothetical protein
LRAALIRRVVGADLNNNELIRDSRIKLLFWLRRIVVQRSTKTIGTVTVVLAKAQAELVNPEKSSGDDPIGSGLGKRLPQ